MIRMLVPLVMLCGMQQMPISTAFSTRVPYASGKKTGRSTTLVWMTSYQKHANNSHRMKPKSSPAINAQEMALKIGLNLVAPTTKLKKKDTSDGGTEDSKENYSREKQNQSKKGRPRPEAIAWGEGVEHFFWPPHSNTNQSTSKKRTQPKVHRLSNHENFPLIHIPGVLSEESLSLALNMTNDDRRDLEDMEQHERLKSGKVHTLRRSLVSQLSTNELLLEELVGRLPVELVNNHEHHPFEDGSVVYYRPGDFYEEHHDSCDYSTTSGDIMTMSDANQQSYPKRKKQRAFTVLVYLKAQPGDARIGGTEFTRLTPVATTNAKAGDGDRSAKVSNKHIGLVVKPNAGDALIWPNFDRNGKPSLESLHRALSVVGTNAQHAMAPTGRTGVEVEKIVVNLWFEGFLKKSYQ